MTKIAIICLWNDEEHIERIKAETLGFTIYLYDGRKDENKHITKVYNQALREIDSDFFLFCHQDVFVDFPKLIHRSMEFFNEDLKERRGDIVGTVGMSYNNELIWGSYISKPIEVDTLDEMCFGFFKSTGYKFDERLTWTNYSQDICCQAHKEGCKAWVIPCNISHLGGHVDWFHKSGVFRKDYSIVQKKWGHFKRT